MLNLKLPFYEAGRIAQIKENDNCFIVDRYGINNNIDKSFVVTNKGNNFEDLLGNYYNDLEGYLNQNKYKYDNALDNQFNKIGYMKYFKNIKYIFALLAFIPPIVGVMIESTILTVMGLILELIFVPSYVVLDRYGKFYDSEEEKSVFVREYNNYSKLLDIYKEQSKKKVKPTKYKGVNKGFDRSKEKVSSYKKEKIIV